LNRGSILCNEVKNNRIKVGPEPLGRRVARGLPSFCVDSGVQPGRGVFCLHANQHEIHATLLDIKQGYDMYSPKGKSAQNTYDTYLIADTIVVF
jgi:hypothetical protein